MIHIYIYDISSLRVKLEGALKSSRPNNEKNEFIISKLFLFYNIISLKIMSVHFAVVNLLPVMWLVQLQQKFCQKCVTDTHTHTHTHTHGHTAVSSV